MTLKAKLPLLLFFFGSFLLSFSSSLAYEEDHEQQLQQCMGLCEKQEKFRDYCKLKCGEEYVEQKKDQERHGKGGSTGRVVFNTTDPQKESRECQHRCELLILPHQKIQQCKERCEEKRREQERQEQRGGGGSGIYNQDPRREYQQCMRRCQQQGGGSQQRQCQERCEEILGEQEREVRRGGDNNADPQREYQQCMRRCQQQGGGSQQRQCQERCEEILGEQEREVRRGEDNNADPQREYQQCMRRCQQQGGGSRQQQRQCQKRCEEILREQEREERRGDNNADPQSKNDDNPYFFDEQSFIVKYKTEEGRIRVLPKFTERSNLHRGIENYRLATFEANPNTFVIPHHEDADVVIYVVKGRGTISMIGKQKRDSFNLERGDVIIVPSGSIVYMVNRDNNEQLHIAKIYQPISKTGLVHEFFGVGGEDPESFYKVFSNEVLEAAFNRPIEELQRLFGQQRKGVIIRASKEQVQELSKQASRTYNILNSMPIYSNKYGKLYEVDHNNYKQLQVLDIAVSFTNITKGAMMAPYYNTRATKLILVVEGRGRFEMACPIRGETEQSGAHNNYERVTASLSPQTMFIVPTGHPVTIIASENENLQLVAFTINAQDSERNFLAGERNVVNQMKNEALELGFNISFREVGRIYDTQTESVFVPGPKQSQQQRERVSHGLSILESQY